jgi:hypothetical protein
MIEHCPQSFSSGGLSKGKTQYGHSQPAHQVVMKADNENACVSMELTTPWASCSRDSPLTRFPTCTEQSDALRFM